MWPFSRKEWGKLGWAWTANTVQAQLISATAPKYIFLRDRDYRAISTKDFEQIVFDCWFPHDEPAYKSEIFDCDDFAVCFMANVKTRWAKLGGKEALAFGYIEAQVEGMSSPHAFIWHMEEGGNVRFYEPQTGSRWTPILRTVRLVEA